MRKSLTREIKTREYATAINICHHQVLNPDCCDQGECVNHCLKLGLNSFVILFFQAYLEFFTCRSNITYLREVLKEYPQVNFHFVDEEVIRILLDSYCIRD